MRTALRLNKAVSILRRSPGMLAILAGTIIAGGGDWLQFRGATSNSVTSEGNLPTEWKEGQNIAWKVALPGRGPSSPIVVGGHVIVTCATGANQDRLHIISFNPATGEREWERQFWATGRTQTHDSISTAAPSPASDGKRVFAFFSSNDLICLDLSGNLLWYRGLAYDFPRAGNDIGMSSSPAVVNGTVIVQVENQGDSFAAGINAETGETRWRLPREREANWASPIVMKGEKAEEDAVLLQSPKGLTAHDPTTGKELWAFDGNCQGIPSAVAIGGNVYIPASGVTAVRPAVGATEPSVLWKAAGVQPGAASPIVHQGKLYAINRSGVLTCADAATGEIAWRLRLSGSFWGTPTLAGDRLYCINQEGVAHIVQLFPDKSGEAVGQGQFGETIQSSPAVSDGALYVRSDKHLWKIAAK